MKRMRAITAATAALAVAGMLSACNQQDGAAVTTPTGTSQSTSPTAAPTTGSGSSSSGSSSSGSADAQGAQNATRAGTLTTDGGWYVEGSKITFVYNNGVRFTIDTGAQITDVQHGKTHSSLGTLTLTPTQATWVGASGAPSTVDTKGVGVAVDKTGAIGVLPDGSVTCVNKQGLQFVGSDGSKGAATLSGLFYVDKTGKKTVAGKEPQGGKLAGRYVVCNVGNTSTVDLFADVLFAYGSATLTPTGKQVIDQAALSIKSHVSGKTVAVVGNTDSMGSDAFNLKLGQQRADAVATQLRNDLPGIKLTVSSNGESQPVAANTNQDGSDNPAGRAKNRRVTISWATN